MTTCAAATKLARAAEALGWTAVVRPGQGELPYQQFGDPRGDGTRPKLMVPEPVNSVGVYLARGPHRLAAFYVAREDPARRTSKGALSWSLDCAVGRRYVADGYTPTAFEQVDTPKGEPPGPTTLAQVHAYLAEHGQAREPEPMEYVDALFAVVDAVATGRPNWSRKDTAA